MEGREAETTREGCSDAVLPCSEQQQLPKGIHQMFHSLTSACFLSGNNRSLTQHLGDGSCGRGALFEAELAHHLANHQPAVGVGGAMDAPQNMITQSPQTIH